MSNLKGAGQVKQKGTKDWDKVQSKSHLYAGFLARSTSQGRTLRRGALMKLIGNRHQMH